MASNIGFAIATLSALKEHPGVTGEQIAEALERLEEALRIASKVE